MKFYFLMEKQLPLQFLLSVFFHFGEKEQLTVMKDKNIVITVDYV